MPVRSNLGSLSGVRALGRHVVLPALWIALAACRPPSEMGAQEQPKPYGNPGTVAGILEEQFTNVIAQCGIPKIYKDRNKTDLERTAIPSLIRQELAGDFAADAVILTGNSPARLMYYIYPKGSGSGGSPTQPSRYLELDKDVSPLSMTREGTSVTAHAHSCSSVVAAATAAGVNVPGGYLKAALEANYRNDQSSRLVMLVGQFFSPFNTNRGVNASGEAFRDLLLAWNWYTANPGEATRENEYISKMDGIALYRAAHAHKAGGGKLDIASAAALPGIANVEASLKVALETEDVTDVKAFSAVVFKTPAGIPRIEVTPLPSPAALAAALGMYTLTLQPDVTSLVVAGASHLHWQELSGVPEAMCSRDVWAIEKDPALNGQMDIAGASRQPNGACRFSVRFTPTPADAARGELRVAYSVKLRAGVGGTSVKFNATPFTITTTDAPRVRVLAFDERWTHVSADVGGVKADSLRWEIKIEWSDAGNPVSAASPVTLEDPSLTCGQMPQTANYTINPVPGNAKRASITIARPVFVGDAFDEAAPPVQCTFAASASLPLAAGGTARRSISGQLKFPTVKVVATH